MICDVGYDWAHVFCNVRYGRSVQVWFARDHVYGSWVLVCGTGFVGLDLGPESGVVGDVVDLSGNAPVVGETVVANYSPCTVAGFFTVLFAVVILDGIAELVGLWVVDLIQKDL